jgi:hypothetical protein
MNMAATSPDFARTSPYGNGKTTVETKIILDKKVVGQTAASYMGALDPNPSR